MAVTRDERLSVGFVAFLSACVGVSYLLTSVGGLSLFVEELGAERLPLLYIVAAPLNIAFGYLDSRVLQQLSTRARMIGLGLVGGVVPVAIGLFTFFGPPTASAFAAPLSYEVMFVFGPLMASVVALHRFDLRQMKRLYSPASSGRWIAQFITGVAVSRFADRVPSGALLVSGGVILLVAAVVAAIAVSMGSGANTSPTPDASVSQDSSRPKVLDAYGKRVVAISAMSAIILLVTDFLLFAQAEHDLSGDELASFLSILLAAHAGSILLLSSVGGRLISRFGIRFGLLLTPVAVVVASVVFLVVASGPFASAALLAASGLYLVENACRYALGIPARQLLSQPLSPVEAKRLHGLAEGPGIAIGVAITAGVLALLVAFGGGARAAALVLAVLCLILIPLALSARSLYVQALETAVTRRQLGQGVEISDVERSALVQVLEGPDPERALSALRLLGDADVGGLGAWSTEVLANRHEAVVRVALDWAETGWFEPSDDSLRTLMEDQRIDWVLRQRAGTFARRRGAAWLGAVVSELTLAGDLAGIALTRDDRSSDSGEELDGLKIEDGTHSERLLLAEVLALTGGPTDTSAILTMLRDPDAEVRRAAAPAIVRVGGDRLWRRAAELVDDALLYEQIAELFDSGRGDHALVERLLDPDVSSARRTRIARLLARSPNVGESNPVWGLVADPDPHVRSSVLATLSSRRDVVPPGAADAFRSALEQMASRCDELRHRIAVDTAAAYSSRYVQGLHELLEVEQVALAHGLAVLGYGERARGLAASLTGGSVRGRAQALELVEEAIAPQDKLFLQAFDTNQSAKQKKSSRAATAAALSNDYQDPWIRLLGELERGQVADPMTLTTVERVLALRATPLFESTASAVLVDLATKMEELPFSKGDIVYSVADRGDRLFVVLEGSVDLRVSGFDITRIEAGEAFGEASLLEGEKRSEEAVATAETLLLSLPMRAFQDLMIDQPDVSMAMLRYVSRRARLRNLAVATGS